MKSELYGFVPFIIKPAVIIAQSRLFPGMGVCKKIRASHLVSIPPVPE